MDMDGMAPQQESIPDFIKLDQIPVNYVQQVETDLLEPVVFNQGSATGDGFARFTLQNKGFLHSHSKVFLAVEPQNGSVTDGYVAPHVGIGNIIKKAVLKIGNKVLNELDNWAGLYAVKSALIGNEVNLERELYTTGRCMSFQHLYDEGSSVDSSEISLDTGFEEDSTNDINVPNWAIHDGTSATTRSEVPTFQIDLSDLFPFLKVNQLPLYMIDEPINIELHFQPQQKYRLQIDNGDSSDKNVNVIRNELKFCADYIFYGATDQMQRYADANRDMSFSFVDYRLMEHSTSQASVEGKVIQNLGMANRMVSRVITLFAPDETATANNEGGILGQYMSLAPTMSASGVLLNDFNYNIRYNDRFEYTSDVDNLARIFSEFTQAEGVPYLTRAGFSDEGIAGNYSDGNITFQGRNQDTLLGAKQFYMATKLTNGRVGQRGVELHVKGTIANINKLRCYLEYMRVARLTNGMIEIFNA